MSDMEPGTGCEETGIRRQETGKKIKDQRPKTKDISGELYI